MNNGKNALYSISRAIDLDGAGRSLKNHTVDILWQPKCQLRIQQIRQVAPIAQVDPLAMRELAGPLLLVHAVAFDDPVVPLWAGDGGAEPDLFVWGLFVQDVGA